MWWNGPVYYHFPKCYDYWSNCEIIQVHFTPNTPHQNPFNHRSFSCCNWLICAQVDRDCWRIPAITAKHSVSASAMRGLWDWIAGAAGFAGSSLTRCFLAAIGRQRYGTQVQTRRVRLKRKVTSLRSELGYCGHRSVLRPGPGWNNAFLEWDDEPRFAC